MITVESKTVSPILVRERAAFLSGDAARNLRRLGREVDHGRLEREQLLQQGDPDLARVG